GVDDARVTKRETLIRRGKQWFRFEPPNKRLFKELQKTLAGEWDAPYCCHQTYDSHLTVHCIRVCHLSYSGWASHITVVIRWAFHITVIIRIETRNPSRDIGESYDVASNAGRSGFDVRPILKGNHAPWQFEDFHGR